MDEGPALDKVDYTWKQKGMWTSKLAVARARYGQLFASWQMSRLTILVWLTYVCDASGFTLAGT